MMENANPMGMYMPVAPAAYGYGGNDNNMFGGNWMWFLLVWMAMFGWGGNGFGFGGNNAYSDVQRGFDQNSVMTGIQGIQNTLTNGFAQAEISANSRQMAEMNQYFNMQNAFQNCCCENRLATANLGTTIAQEGAMTRAASAADKQVIMDKLCQLEMDGMKQNYEGQLRDMQIRLNAKDSENQSLRFLASQGAQTSQIMNAINSANNNFCDCGA